MPVPKLACQDDGDNVDDFTIHVYIQNERMRSVLRNSQEKQKEGGEKGAGSTAQYIALSQSTILTWT